MNTTHEIETVTEFSILFMRIVDGVEHEAPETFELRGDFTGNTATRIRENLAALRDEDPFGIFTVNAQRFTTTYTDGQVLDSSESGGPFTFGRGTGAEFSRALEQMVGGASHKAATDGPGDTIDAGVSA